VNTSKFLQVRFTQCEGLHVYPAQAKTTAYLLER